VPLGPEDESFAPDGRGTNRGDWRPERVRDALLWLGSLLLILSAITFVVVAWSHLTPLARAGVLAGGTAVSGSIAWTLRRRLAATAEALTALTIGLALVDWRALERTTLAHGTSTAAWWAIGLGALGIGTALLGRTSSLTVLRLTPSLALPATGTSGLIALSPTLAQATLGVALITTIVTVRLCTLRHTTESVMVGAWRLVACVGELATISLASIALIDAVSAASPHPVGTLTGPGFAILAIAAAPLTALVLRRAGDAGADAGLAGLVTIAGLGAITAIVEPALEVHATLAVLGAACVLVMLTTRWSPRTWRPGIELVGLLGLVPVLIGTVRDVGAAWRAPLRWVGDPWSRAAGSHLRHPLHGHDIAAVEHPVAVVVGLLVVAVALVAVDRWKPGRTVGAGLVGMALAVGLAGANPTIGVTLAIQLTVASGLALVAVLVDANDRDLARDLVVGALSTSVPAVGWAATSETTTIVSLGVVTVVGIVARGVASSARGRSAATAIAAAGFLVETGFVVHALGASDAAAGSAVFVAAAAFLTGARFVVRAKSVALPLEVVACLGAVAGVIAASTSPTLRAVVVAASVPVLVLAGRADDHRSDGYDGLALLAALGTTVSLVGEFGAAVELASIPAALAAIAAGHLARLGPETGVRRARTFYGPGLLVGFAPSVAIAVQQGGALRPMLVLLAAGVTVFAGARLSLRAPILVGATAAIVLALDGIAPLAAQLPRWLLIGIIGTLALWAGATADRRLDQLRRWRNAIDQLA
ncbi:MAG: hypothetical protein ABJC79_06410, partial [Acidimicrobiia bacterium]